MDQLSCAISCAVGVTELRTTNNVPHINEKGDHLSIWSFSVCVSLFQYPVCADTITVSTEANDTTEEIFRRSGSGLPMVITKTSAAAVKLQGCLQEQEMRNRGFFAMVEFTGDYHISVIRVKNSIFSNSRASGLSVILLEESKSK